MSDHGLSIAFVAPNACSVLPGRALDGTASRDSLIHEEQSQCYYSSA